MAFEPIEIAYLELAGGNNEIVVRGEAGNGQICLNTAYFVEPLGIDQTPWFHRHIVSANLVEHLLGVPPLQTELGEGALVQKPYIFAYRSMLLGRGIKPVLTTITIFVSRLAARFGVPVGTLPSKRDAMTGTLLNQSVMDW